MAGSLRDDNEGLTAVIEFLTAFVLFLMIVTAFLSLAQLTLGPYDSTTDRLDEAAVVGLGRLTDSPGWFTPADGDDRDVDNATVDWHKVDSATLSKGDVLPGLLSANGGIDIERLSALSNVTESQLARGLGMDEHLNLRLMIKIIDSDNTSRIGLSLFDDGTNRSKARDSATASRTFSMGDEVVRVTLEVHDGFRGFTQIQLTEFMPRPASGGPEWVELYNPNGFAVEMEGWAVARSTPGYGTSSILFQNGTIPGGARVLISGDAGSQVAGNSTWVHDSGSSGLLGVGAIEGLGDSIGRLELTRASRTTSGVTTLLEVEWDQSWPLSSGSSMTWNGGDSMDVDSWDMVAGGTPGD